MPTFRGVQSTAERGWRADGEGLPGKRDRPRLPRTARGAVVGDVEEPPGLGPQHEQQVRPDVSVGELGEPCGQDAQHEPGAVDAVEPQVADPSQLHLAEWRLDPEPPATPPLRPLLCTKKRLEQRIGATGGLGPGPVPPGVIVFEQAPAALLGGRLDCRFCLRARCGAGTSRTLAPWCSPPTKATRVPHSGMSSTRRSDGIIHLRSVAPR